MLTNAATNADPFRSPAAAPLAQKVVIVNGSAEIQILPSSLGAVEINDKVSHYLC